MGDFDWDDSNRDHIARHGITPEEAEQVYLNDPLDEDWYEEDGEERFAFLGETDNRRILRLIITMRGELVRVVTCFDPPKTDRLAYMHLRW
jgi:uncharacterized DUF497 family protein